MRAEVEQPFDRIGTERARVQLVLLPAGRHRGEFAAIRVRYVLLDERQPAIGIPDAAAEKRERATQSLRAGVAAGIRAWIGEIAVEVCRDRIGVAGTVGRSSNCHCSTRPRRL